MVARHLGTTLISVLLVLGSVVSASARPAALPCAEARFVLRPALTDPTLAFETVVIRGTAASVGDACPPVKAKLRRARSIVEVRVRWPACKGLPGAVRLRARIMPDCTGMAGTVRAQGSNLRVDFAAVRSECGDGALDRARGEQCEDGAPCGAGQQCVDCVCVSSCGDGVLDPDRGEQCENGIGCGWGQECVGCACVPAWPQATTTSTSTTTTTLPPVSFSRDVAPVLAASCALPLCHVGPRPRADLDLSAGVAYDGLANVPSGECALERVAPGVPEASYLIAKLRGEGPCFVGVRMPPRGPLPPGDLDRIAAWIAQGAPDN